MIFFTNFSHFVRSPKCHQFRKEIDTRWLTRLTALMMLCLSSLHEKRQPIKTKQKKRPAIHAKWCGHFQRCALRPSFCVSRSSTTLFQICWFIGFAIAANRDFVSWVKEHRLSWTIHHCVQWFPNIIIKSRNNFRFDTTRTLTTPSHSKRFGRFRRFWHWKSMPRRKMVSPKHSVQTLRIWDRARARTIERRCVCVFVCVRSHSKTDEWRRRWTRKA